MFKDRFTEMLKDLDFKWAAKRAGFVVVIYLVLMYAVSQLGSGNFGPKNASQWKPILINAAIFFFVFTFFYAFLERSRRRRMSQGPPRKRVGAKKEQEREAGPLKGRPNPNTSKRKATRRRR